MHFFVIYSLPLKIKQRGNIYPRKRRAAIDQEEDNKSPSLLHFFHGGSLKGSHHFRAHTRLLDTCYLHAAWPLVGALQNSRTSYPLLFCKLQSLRLLGGRGGARRRREMRLFPPFSCASGERTHSASKKEPSTIRGWVVVGRERSLSGGRRRDFFNAPRRKKGSASALAWRLYSI